jgi:hypothetical protein
MTAGKKPLAPGKLETYSDLPPEVAKLLAQRDHGSPKDRGKDTEGHIKRHFENLNRQILPFMFEKLPDARSARGAFKAVLCDFNVLCRSVSFYIEAKETEHPYRLARDKIPQIAKLRKAELAGGVPFVLVYHSLLGQWRCLPISYFDGPIPASWDLRNAPLFDDLKSALASIPQWKAVMFV